MLYSIFGILVSLASFRFIYSIPALCEDVEGGEVIGRVVESQSLVKSRDLFKLRLLKIKVADVQVLLESGLGVGLWNDGNSALGNPAENDLGWGLLVLF